jgi:hypothetical protein
MPDAVKDVSGTRGGQVATRPTMAPNIKSTGSGGGQVTPKETQEGVRSGEWTPRGYVSPLGNANFPIRRTTSPARRARCSAAVVKVLLPLHRRPRTRRPTLRAYSHRPHRTWAASTKGLGRRS